MIIPLKVNKEKGVSNCLDTVYRVLRSPDILLYSCYDNTLSLSSTEHMQVYFVLCKQCLHTGILEFDTLFLPTLLVPLVMIILIFVH